MGSVDAMMEKWDALVKHIAFKHFGGTATLPERMDLVRAMTMDDILQYGRIGLWNAICKFDESKGYQFSTYAYRAIFNSIVQCLKLKKPYTAFLKEYKRFSGEASHMDGFCDKNISGVEHFENIEEAHVYLKYARTAVDEETWGDLEAKADGASLRGLARVRGVSRQYVSKNILTGQEKALDAINHKVGKHFSKVA